MYIVVTINVYSFVYLHCTCRYSKGEKQDIHVHVAVGSLGNFRIQRGVQSPTHTCHVHILVCIDVHVLYMYMYWFVLFSDVHVLYIYWFVLMYMYCTCTYTGLY